MNKKPICYAPFIGMYADHTGKYAPCCVSKKIESTSIENFWSSQTMVEMRTKLLNNEWPTECSYCKNRVEKNLETDITVWKKTAQKIYDLELNVETGNQKNSPLLLDFRPGNKCNLKCRMCGPKFSSQWQNELEQNTELSTWMSQPKIEDNKMSEFIKFSDNLDLVQIKILGGEPTIDENVLLFLENMISKKEKLPKLNFTTNGTNLNKRFRDIIKHFENIHIVFSVDGVGREFEYIRTNASWKKVKKNIENFFENDIAKMHTFNTILMPYNIFSLKSLIKWYVELYNKDYYFSLCVDTSEAPYTSLSAVLPEDIKTAINELEEYFKTVNPKFFKEIDGANDFLHILKSVKFNESDYKKFKEYNNLLDKVRHTSLILIDERFSKYV